MAVIEVTDKTFEQEMKEGLVLVDFWAPWCGPCRMQGPILDDLAGELEGSLTVAKLNVDENPEVAGRFGIMSIPTMMVFKDGEAVKTMVGVHRKDQLTDILNPYL
ncbi:thioredoxin [Vagococcus humatus]|uniref:Thioredoxin n=1 Tax=Vagococcus humatus TaxID=1889241 RepID=A0A429Z9C6_9ENTE|nr:thioredoxin [Vagococcus humatus]RST90294.1 thioredoxin [Vagococcus humatus]